MPSKRTGLPASSFAYPPRRQFTNLTILCFLLCFSASVSACSLTRWARLRLERHELFELGDVAPLEQPYCSVASARVAIALVHVVKQVAANRFLHFGFSGSTMESRTFPIMNCQILLVASFEKFMVVFTPGSSTDSMSLKVIPSHLTLTSRSARLSRSTTARRKRVFSL